MSYNSEEKSASYHVTGRGERILCATTEEDPSERTDSSEEVGSGRTASVPTAPVPAVEPSHFWGARTINVPRKRVPLPRRVTFDAGHIGTSQSQRTTTRTPPRREQRDESAELREITQGLRITHLRLTHQQQMLTDLADSVGRVLYRTMESRQRTIAAEIRATRALYICAAMAIMMWVGVIITWAIITRR